MRTHPCQREILTQLWNNPVAKVVIPVLPTSTYTVRQATNVRWMYRPPAKWHAVAFIFLMATPAGHETPEDHEESPHVLMI